MYLGKVVSGRWVRALKTNLAGTSAGKWEQVPGWGMICAKSWLVKKDGTNYFSKPENRESIQNFMGDKVRM